MPKSGRSIDADISEGLVNQAQEDEARLRRGARRWLIREGVGVLFVALLLFIPAGRIDWGMGWALVGLYAVWVAANALLLMPRSPGLLAERASRQRSAKTWDTVLVSVIGLTTMAKYVIAGLDLRYSWTTAFPFWLQVFALAIAASGFGIVTWSMVANAFFSMVNRIQTERGHTVATGGPYRYVRHPGYVGGIGFELATPLMLGSLWALIPGVLAAFLYVVRTVLEDRMLHQELAGYRAYAQRVRYRLLPGIW